MNAAASEVEVTRLRGDFVKQLSTSESHMVAVGLGSNLGDRWLNIETAVQKLHNAGVEVISTSFLYETPPMYVEKQPPFLNGACLVRTRNMWEQL